MLCLRLYTNVMNKNQFLFMLVFYFIFTKVIQGIYLEIVGLMYYLVIFLFPKDRSETRNCFQYCDTARRQTWRHQLRLMEMLQSEILSKDQQNNNPFIIQTHGICFRTLNTNINAIVVKFVLFQLYFNTFGLLTAFLFIDNFLIIPFKAQFVEK